jgi:NAD(P)H-hydrate epimerase
MITAMLKRLLERGMPMHEPLPPRTALSDPELKAGLLREVDLFDGLGPAQLKEISRTLPMATCHVGGLVTSPPDADYQPLIGMTSVPSAPVISLDVPSGIDASTGERRGAAVDADATLALALPKLGTTLGEGKRFAGALYLADIGIPACAFRELGIEPGFPFAAGPLLRLS